MDKSVGCAQLTAFTADVCALITRVDVAILEGD